MRLSALKYTVLTWVSVLSLLIFMLVPFQGLLSVSGSSLVGHYTALRLWDEAILLLCIIGTVYLFLTDRTIRFNTLSRRLVWLILVYILINLLWGALAYANHALTLKALGYGLIVNLRFVIFFLVTWSAALILTKLRTHWQWLVIYPSILVVVFGLLQVFVLPSDFLRHLGYGPKTIPVIETINNNPHFLRYASTTRGANPLGAYLIIPISLLSVLIIKPRRNYKQVLFLIASIILLFFTFSRSAWIGAAVSIVIILFCVQLPKKIDRLIKFSLLGLIVIGALIGVIFRNNSDFQNYVFHTQKNSLVKTTSNGNHVVSVESGVKYLIKHPLGSGPGSAGPASLYNNNKSHIAENYFLQVGDETGWLGLVVFILINVGVGYLLWLRRSDTLSLSLFAALIAISIVNLVEPAWTDDTLAYIWWGLAGVAMAPDKRLKYKKIAE